MTTRTIAVIDISKDKTLQPETLGLAIAGVTDTLVDTAGNIILVSRPPSGGHKIYNIWRNGAGNISYEYEIEPEP